jgi:glutathione S-transferase
VYTLYYAPDNASLIVRVVLEELGVSYNTWLVDRSTKEQESQAYRKLNPNGLIPVCIMDGEPVFETAAIILALTDRHGSLAPPLQETTRPQFLKWLFFLSNTLHSDLRQLFYPHKYGGSDEKSRKQQDQLTRDRLHRHFTLLEHHYGGLGERDFDDENITIVDIYAAICLRWSQLYPMSNPGTFKPDDYPALSGMLAVLQRRPAMIRSFEAEGIPPPYLLDPQYPDGSKGSAI